MLSFIWDLRWYKNLTIISFSWFIQFDPFRKIGLELILNKIIFENIFQ